MRSFVTLGVLSLLGAAALVACGDDDPGPAAGGSGGSGGSGGARAGAGGMAGSGTAGTPTGGMGGGGGAGGATADVTPQATCTGCVELIVPAVGPNDNGGTVNLADQVGFQFGVAAPGADMTNGVLTWRIAAVAPNADTFVTLYAQNGMALNYAGAYLTVALAPAAFAANTFVDVVFDLASVGGAAGDAGAPVGDAGDAGGGGTPAGAAPTIVGTFDKALIAQYGITVGVGATFTGSTTVRVAVDSVTIVGVPGQANKTFDTTAEGLAINAYQVPPGTPAPFPHPAP